MYVVATAGHVDHGKSTLVRALTGIEPDRWEEERRRGLTIDLGFAWTTLPSGNQVAFVDVPGHERFLGNMLAGLGPVPVVCFVVAADEGWSAQSNDHRDAVVALGIEHGVVVLTRADKASPERIEATREQVRRELAGTGLADASCVVVSAVTGSGMDELRTVLDRVLDGVPRPDPAARVRLWVDRSFSVVGAGTVVTGTLPAGTVRVGDELELLGADGARRVVVRGLQRHGEAADAVGPVSRVAVNLRGVAVDEVRRGDALVTVGAWPTTSSIDVVRTFGAEYTHVTVHAGTAAVPARVRPLDAEHARITLGRPLPLLSGDRVVLRGPGSSGVLGGATVLDADPPALRRRGDAARRASGLRAQEPGGDVAAEVARRSAVRREHLLRLGLIGAEAEPPHGVLAVGDWWLDHEAADRWGARLAEAVARKHADDPLAVGLSFGAARDLLGLPDGALLLPLAQANGLTAVNGHLAEKDRRVELGAAEAGVAELEHRLAAEPFRAPEADDLAALRLGPRELAVAERAGRLLRLDDGVVLLPSAPALAMRNLARLPQPFTTSDARKALGTSRRVAIPLLEHLDGRRWTRRIDAGHREVVR